MDDLHELAQAIADAASDRERERHGDKYPSIPMAATVYHHVYRAVMDNADEIAFVYQLQKMKKPHPQQAEIDAECVELLRGNMDVKVDMLEMVTVIDAHNDLHDALEDIAKYARREPENPDDAIAIIFDVLERAQEALNG